MKLFGNPESGHAFKVKFFLEAAEVDHDYEMIDIFMPREQRSEEFRRHTRFHEVPLLVDNGQGYTQSNAILVYLADKLGKYGAENPHTLQQSNQWLCWEANRIGMCLPQLRVAHRFPEDAPNAGALEWLTDRFHYDIDILDREFADGREFILGDQPVIADFSLCGYLFLADEAKMTLPTSINQWLNRLRELPGWAPHAELLA